MSSANGIPGPSPRAWGKQWQAGLTPDEKRTIPTGVGKTSSSASARTRGPDHPHRRGGKLSPATCRRGRTRTIPTGVGKTPNKKSFAHRAADHPHGRGGKPRGATQPMEVLRTIPTGVGKTWAKSPSRRIPTDHPHGRGENPVPPEGQTISTGPSPRAWGKPNIVGPLSGSARTIPTGVGKTIWNGRNIRTATDHPHGRGENTNPT